MTYFFLLLENPHNKLINIALQYLLGFYSLLQIKATLDFFHFFNRPKYIYIAPIKILSLIFFLLHRLLGEPCETKILKENYRKSSSALPGDHGLDFKSESAAIYILVS